MNRTLSSPLTFLYKFLVSPLCAGVVLWCAFTCVQLSDNLVALPAALLGGALFLGGFIHFASLKKVVLRGEFLVVSNFVTSQTFPLSTITSVEGSALLHHRPVWVGCRSGAGKAKTVVFMPPLLFMFFQVHPVVQELRSLVANSQQGARCAGGCQKVLGNRSRGQL